MATKIARQLKLVPKATDEVIAKHTEALAPHGLAYEPPPYNEVLELIKEAAVEGVDRKLRDPNDGSWLLPEVRDLLMAFYPGVWEVANKGRGLRSRAEQNEIFKLNHHVALVRSKLTGKDVRHHTDSWDLNMWKAEQNGKAEWEAAKASLPAKLRDNYDQVQWVLTEKKMRAEHAKQNRYYAKIQKKRIAEGTLSAKDLKEIEKHRAAKTLQWEKELERLKRWHTATVEERVKMQKAKDAARKKMAKK